MRSTTTLTVIAIILSLILGILLGFILKVVTYPVLPTVIHEDKRPTIPVVMISDVQDGSIIGTVHGDARFFVSGIQVLPIMSGSFKAPAASLLKNLTTMKIPTGMRFVASKRGKKYYPVGSRGAANLSPANRVYFKTADEAQAAGYEPSS